MPASNAFHRIATNPQDYLRWQTTGRFPQGQKPGGPLIALLQALSPRDRMALRGVTVNASLGYNGSRVFACAEQALRWAAPSREVFGSFPAQSWQIRRVTQVSLDDVLANCAHAPEGIRERYSHLCLPKRPIPSVPETPSL